MLPDAGPLTRRLNRRLFVPVSPPSEERIRPLIVINYLPTAASLALMEALEPDVKIYHFASMIGSTIRMRRRETETDLIAAVDMVWADSPVNSPDFPNGRQRRSAAAWGRRRSIHPRQEGPDVPPDRPLCAYFGTVGISTDIDLLRAVSHRFPLRLIGPVRTSLEVCRINRMIGPVPPSANSGTVTRRRRLALALSTFTPQ